MTPRDWIISHRCSWIIVYVFCRNAHSESHSDPHDICMLALANCSMLLFILWRDTTSELWTPVQFLYIAITVLLLLALFTLLQTITFYHSIRLILCSQQTGEIDNLIVSWDKVLDCVVCRFHIATGEKLHADKLLSAIVRSVTKLAGINLRKFGSFFYWFAKPWFHN
jgi:uncharacterized membrane protein YhhN